MLSFILAIASITTAGLTTSSFTPADMSYRSVATPAPVEAPADTAVNLPAPPQPVPTYSRPEPVDSRSYNDDDDGRSDDMVLDADKMNAAYDKARSDISTQWEFPEHKVEPTPKWMLNLSRFFDANWDGLRIVIYALLGLLALYILYRLFPPFRDFVDRTLGRMRAQKEEDVEEDWAPQASVAIGLLAEADQLATQGRYAEAVHLLLGRSIEDIGRRRPQLLKPALTARDIAQSPDLPEAARGAFTTIANVVELSHFGRRPVDASGWQQCRDAYSRFALRENWSAQAKRVAPASEVAAL